MKICISENCKEKQIAKGLCKKHYSSMISRAWHIRKKIDVINHYSNGMMCCDCCGENNIGFLTINHINGDGAKHRKKLGSSGTGVSFYKWLIKNNFPDGLNVLCWNCNSASGATGICPHLVKGVRRKKEGFGYKRNDEGKLILKPHMFGVKIGKDVDVGRFTNIDAGSYRDTEIGDNTKIDAEVHVGHNSRIGKHVLIVAHAVIGGSAEIGDYSYIGMGALILDHVTIGKHCLIGAGAVVTKDVPDKVCVYGNPAEPRKCNLKPEDLYNMCGLREL